MDLFLDKEPLSFEKLAFESRMGEDMNDWPQEVLDELFRQAPFTSNYSPKVVIREKDEDRRYALGHVELYNQLAINPRDDNTPSHLRGRQKVVVPVVIKDGRLLPLDLIVVNGEAEPLTDERLRKAMFRPNLFEAIQKRPGDVSMIEQLYPPHRSTNAAGGSGTMGTKTASPRYLMDAILPTIKLAHIHEVEDAMSDPSLRTALLENEAVSPFLHKLAQRLEAGEPEAADYLQMAVDAIKPNVVQIQKIAGGFRIKTANSQALIPTSDDVDKPTAIGSLGGDLVNAAELDGTVTLTSTPVVKDTLSDIIVKVIDEFGLYKVRTSGTDQELVGWVFPKVMDLGGEVLPLSAFSNGSQSGLQENIAGVPIDRSTDIIDVPPKGTGCFYYTEGSGAVGLVPITVKGEADGKIVGETALGEQVTLSKQPGLKTIEQLGEGEYAIPDTMGFMPMEANTKLVSIPDEFTKTGQAHAWLDRVEVFSDGVTFSFQGDPIDKIAHVIPTQALERDDAVFLATILGQNGDDLIEKVAQYRDRVADGTYVTAFSAAPVTTAQHHMGMAKQAAAKRWAEFPNMAVDLIKEAAPLEDPASVDKVLSLKFINPENLMTFAGYVPEFEDTIRKLSTLLLATRMGLSAVDEHAVHKCVTHMDKVVDGLKSLTATPQA